MKTSVEDAAQRIHRKFGRIDILVNNAGILGSGAPLWELQPADFNRVMAVNLTGMYLVCRALVPRIARAIRPGARSYHQCFFNPGQRGIRRSRERMEFPKLA
jgi:NAD(P)-dependent dehydrogenase (short-subunit alcohol dehydrogenase family)